MLLFDIVFSPNLPENIRATAPRDAGNCVTRRRHDKHFNDASAHFNV
jgi:hypothetical protein